MNFDQLKYFTTIAETLNYSHSSQILNVTQPALSLSISRLEEEIGFPLFVKKGRNIELTPYGERFYEHANIILNNLKVALSDMAALDDNSPNSIAFAMNICFNYDYINTIIDAFRAKYPQYNMDIMQMDFSDILPVLKNGYIPFALTHLNEEQAAKENMCAAPVAQYPLFVFLSEKHPLAKEKLITTPMLKGGNLLVRTFQFKQKAADIKIDSVNLYNFDEITVVPSETVMEQLAANNEGFIIGNFALTPQMQEKGIKRIPYNNFISTYYFVWSNNRILTKSESLFKDFVLEYIKDHPLDPNTI